MSRKEDLLDLTPVFRYQEGGSQRGIFLNGALPRLRLRRKRKCLLYSLREVVSSVPKSRSR